MNKDDTIAVAFVVIPTKHKRISNTMYTFVTENIALLS